MNTLSNDAGWISRSHRAISPFQLLRPRSLEEAVEANAREDGATFIGGGIDVVRRMRSGDRWHTLIDISSVSGLDGISDQDDRIRIGACTTHWDIETSPLLAEKLPSFQAAWITIGNVRVRMAGTIGGNIMAGEAGYDGSVILGVLGAELVFMTSQGEVTVAADCTRDSYPAGALLSAIDIPTGGNAELVFDRSLKPVVSVAASVDEDSFRIGIGCAFSRPVFQTGTGRIESESVSAGLPEPIDNPLGGADYRRRMSGVLAARAYAALTGWT